MIKKGFLLLIAIILISLAGFVFLHHSVSADFNQSRIIDDSVFDNTSTMNASQIDTFLNTFSGSCISTNHGFSAPDPTGYNPSQGFLYGSNVSAGQIIYDAAQAYGINPQVLLATLQKEQSLVTGSAGCSTLQYAAATGYGCPDGGTTYSYSGVDLYAINGTTVTSVSGTCVNTSLKVGFSQQVIRAAWLLKFGEQRSEGNIGWAVIKGNWNNSDDPQTCYSGPMTQGTWQVCPSGASAYYDGYTTIDGTSVYLDSGATAALYWYTPHFSGNQNFVNIFDSWFGSTYATVVMSSALRVSTVPEGVYSEAPTTASFDMANDTNSSMTLNVAVTVRDSSGGNHDFPLKTITINAHATATYSATQTFTTEDTYTFGITSYSNGVWDTNFPASSDIANPRTLSFSLQNMPTVTVAPSSNVSDMRIGKTANISFTVTNNSAQPINIGQIVLALRDPSDNNVDLPLVSPGNIAAGAQYVYSQPFTPQKIGTYNGFISDTMNHGASWDATSFPAQASGILRSISFTVKSSPTLTVGPALSITSPRVGQQVSATFTIHNYGSSAANIGGVALAIRDPNNHNVDCALQTPTISAGQDYVYTCTTTFNTAGTYTGWLVNYSNGIWNDTNPVSENSSVGRAITFVVQPSPTVTVGPALSITSPRVGQQVTGSFTLHNYGDTAVNVGGIALAVRDSRGKNADFVLQNVTIQPGNDYVYTASNIFTAPGTYTTWITDTTNGGQSWNDTNYPAMESGSVARKISFAVLPSPTITVSPALSVPSPRVGQQVSATFTIHNYGSSAASIGGLALALRDPNNKNVDCPLQTPTIQPGQDFVYSCTTTFNTAGTYTGWIANYASGTWNSTNPSVDSGSVVRTLNFAVLPSPTLTVGPALSITSPRVGQQVSATFTIHNYGSSAANIGGVALAIRDPNNHNVDCALQTPTISAGQDYVYTCTTTFNTAGTYTGWLVNYSNGIWNDTNPVSENSSVGRAITFVVQP